MFGVNEKESKAIFPSNLLIIISLLYSWLRTLCYFIFSSFWGLIAYGLIQCTAFQRDIIGWLEGTDIDM